MQIIDERRAEETAGREGRIESDWWVHVHERHQNNLNIMQLHQRDHVKV